MIKNTNHIQFGKLKNLNIVSNFAFRASNFNIGFTLIEVLVAATLIGLLATVGVTGFQAITKSGRDALRKSDLEQVRSALEIYKAENSEYPDDDDDCTVSLAITPAFAPDYITGFPADPKTPYVYCYDRTAALTYDLCAHLENGGETDYCGDDENCGGDCNYKVTNP